MTDHRGTDWVFSNLSKGEAEKYFRRYVDESEERVAAFIESVAARGGRRSISARRAWPGWVPG